MSLRLHGRRTHAPACSILLLSLIFLTVPSLAQDAGHVTGHVQDATTAEVLAGATVQVSGTTHGTATASDGSFRLTEVPAGAATLEVRFVGYRPHTRTVEVHAGDTVHVRIDLVPQQIDLGGIEVTALRPDLQPTAELEAAQVREANPRDSGELLREVPGVAAVRRGPLGLDPVVRGLRETEVGTYLDGTRIFPGGPARMDSPLSHLDPSAIRTIEVVKGPYALTWGAGNMSAIRVETQPLGAVPAGLAHGRVATGYDTNFGAYEGALAASGRSGAFAYQLHSAWREGNDYRTGAGDVVPADFLSRELRAKVGYRLNLASQVTLAGGYQNQRDIDYPGRLLDASYFDVYNLSAHWQMERRTDLVREAEVLAYINDVEHGMDNDGKPTAQPDPDRMPPFALQVNVESAVQVRGGRAAVTMAPRSLTEVELGTDVYRAHRNAIRTIRRRDNGMVMFEDLMWPEATITDAGLFTRVDHTLNRLTRVSGTVRFDAVRAEADTASTFFQENVSRDLDATETHLSGAFTVSFNPTNHWTASVGVGSVVRTADATERYSDRIPASKAQTSAEFVGNPGLQPERSTQADLWLEASYPRWMLSINAFGRRVDDYITLAPTNLPKRLPLSPETVFRYVNGEAVFWGFETMAAVRVIPAVRLEGALHYLWGRDEQLDEPALGILPFGGNLGLRLEPPQERFFVQSTLHALTEQVRVATTRGEVPTDAYVTLDLRGGIDITNNVSLQAGANNLLGRSYVNHLNAKNPFTRQQIPEPGRVFFVDVTVGF